jgi:hypothetical protein
MGKPELPEIPEIPAYRKNKHSEWIRNSRYGRAATEDCAEMPSDDKTDS